MEKDMFYEIKKSTNSLASALKLLEGVKSPYSLARYIIDKIYFKNVYGQDYNTIRKELYEEFHLVDDYLSVIKYMDNKNQAVLVNFINNVTKYTKTKYGFYAKRDIFEYAYDYSILSKKYLKEKIIEDERRDSTYTDLKKCIFLNLTEEKIMADDALKKSFNEKQQNFLEQEETYHYNNHIYSNLR